MPVGAAFRDYNPRTARHVPAYSGVTAAAGVAGRALATTTGYVVHPAVGQGLYFSRLAVITPDAAALANGGCLVTSQDGYHVGGSEWRLTTGGEHELLSSYIALIGTSSGAGIAAGKTSVLGMTYDGTTVRFFADGRSCGSTAGSYSFTVSNGLIFRLSNGVNQFSGSMSLYVELPFLSDRIMRDLTANPWDVFAAEDAPQFYSLGSGPTFQAAWAARSNAVIQGALHA